LRGAIRSLHKDKVQRLDLARLDPGRLIQILARLRERMEGLGHLLDSFSYGRVLARGFALVRDRAGLPIMAAASVQPSAALVIQFADGAVPVTADGDPQDALRKAAGMREPAAAAPTKKQGSLF
jgi:exodeoxyribonuclease VII large subunit